MRVTKLLASGFLLLSLSGCDIIQSRDLIRQANSLYSDTSYKKAIELYNQAATLDPNVPELYWNRACAAEALVLRMKDDAKRAAERKQFADQALQDFRKWKDRLKDPTPEDNKNYAEHRLALLSADNRCDDLIAHWREKLQTNPKAEGLYSVIARTYDETCDDKLKATQWFIKRTKDFPESASAWYALGVRTFEPLFPEADSLTPFNESIEPAERLKRADEVIAVLQKATKLKPNYRDPYVWRAMAYTQKSLARQFSTDSVEPKEKLEAILAREDSMAAWKEQRQVCNIDKLPECPVAPTNAEIFADLGRYSKSGTLLTLAGKTVAGSAKPVSGKDRTYSLTLEVKVPVPEPKSKRRRKRKKEPAKPRFEKRPVQVQIALAAPQKDEEGKAIDDSEEIKARVDAWNEGSRASFDGQLAKDGASFSVQERSNLGCCPPAPITDEEVAADLKLKKELEDELANGGKSKKKRRRRRRR